VLRPTSGTFRIFDVDPLVDSVAVKRKIGVLPEDLALFDRLTGAETLSFIGQVYGLDNANLKLRSAELLELMDLEQAAGDLVTDYSHGMRKKLALAVALLPAPRLLFLDEPFEGIDAIASRQIKELLSRFVRGGGTIFLTSHILEIVERLCDYIGVIHKGKLVAQGPLAELRAGIGVGKTLEEIFLELVGAESAHSPALDWLAL
jgi:ABC-2 type transport system ATP-binding protein